MFKANDEKQKKMETKIDNSQKIINSDKILNFQKKRLDLTLSSSSCSSLNSFISFIAIIHRHIYIVQILII